MKVVQMQSVGYDKVMKRMLILFKVYGVREPLRVRGINMGNTK